MDAWIEEYVKRLDAAHVATPTSLVGCKSAEVDGLEAEFGVRLPIRYKAMLQRFGKSAGRLVDRSEMDFYYEAVLGMNRRLRVVDLGIHLPERAFVIRARYGEAFEFVCHAPEAMDAPVYYVTADDPEGDAAPYHPSLTVWLDALLHDATGAPG